MSHTLHPLRQQRLQRSELAVPACFSELESQIDEMMIGKWHQTGSQNSFHMPLKGMTFVAPR